MPKTSNESPTAVGHSRPAVRGVQTRFARLLLVVGCLAGIAANASIEGSKHDFRSADSRSGSGSSSTEICVFCHTPTGVDTSADALRWNTDADGQEYGRPASFGVTGMEQNVVGPPSVTCLSCHDGAQAPDAAYVGLDVPGTWTAQRSLAEIAGSSEVSLNSPYPVSDFRFGHPINVSYAGGVCRGLEKDCDPAATEVRNTDFRAAQFTVFNSVKSWWVDTDKGVPGVRDKSDVILYPRDFDGTVGPAVECGSCHDPHDGRERPVSFLRVPGNDSTLCLSCHIK